MNEKFELEDTESITTHISIPCTKSAADRYKSIAKRLDELKKKKLLTHQARQALMPVIEKFEQAIADLDKGA